MKNAEIQENQNFRILGHDENDRTYFILAENSNQAYWCRSNQRIGVGNVVTGKLKERPKCIPTLLVHNILIPHSLY